MGRPHADKKGKTGVRGDFLSNENGVRFTYRDIALENGVRFTYPVALVDFAGRYADGTLEKVSG